jgi:hypothetical protein
MSHKAVIFILAAVRSWNLEQPIQKVKKCVYMFLFSVFGFVFLLPVTSHWSYNTGFSRLNLGQNSVGWCPLGAGWSNISELYPTKWGWIGLTLHYQDQYAGRPFRDCVIAVPIQLHCNMLPFLVNARAIGQWLSNCDSISGETYILITAHKKLTNTNCSQ